MVYCVAVIIGATDNFGHFMSRSVGVWHSIIGNSGILHEGCMF